VPSLRRNSTGLVKKRLREMQALRQELWYSKKGSRLTLTPCAAEKPNW
jgi:hypothetical protein